MRRLLIILFVLNGFTAAAQRTYTSSGRPLNAMKKKEQHKKGFDPSRIVLGGGIGFSLTDEITTFSISPVVGYRVLDKLAVGIGGGYQYFQQKDFFSVTDQNGFQSYYDLKASITSVSVWVRYMPFKHLIVHAEYEHNFFSFNNYGFDPNGTGNIVPYKERYNAPSVLLGIGYRQPIGANTSMFLMGMYDVVQDKYSPYGNSIFPRIGFNIGF